MDLFFSSLSPYARKVMIVAHELGLVDQITKLDCHAHPVQRDQRIIAHNPLGQVPTLILKDGTVLADSRVICEYLNDLGRGSVFPKTGTERWQALTDQSLGDGMLAAALTARYETTARPIEKQWDEWIASHLDKSSSSLSAIEKYADKLINRMDIGTITIACALSYVDLRFPDFGWRKNYPAVEKWIEEFEKRPSLAATRLRP